ncbi:MAG TPA: UDP-N-acetylmuramoyl-L-alanine--D-glutamate ligase [Thiolinea sp.]|nr:UDP-N-acetylmuramoyl-L-alanine--D-glutamate ligase [Thiolinea sp.]
MSMNKTPNKPETLIVGLGQTGLSVARYLGRKGIPFAVMDSRENPPGLDELRQEFPGVSCHLGGFEASQFSGIRQLIVSPGVALATPEIRRAITEGAEALGDVELFVREAQSPIIAITGSNGKSSVTQLVELMARRAGLVAHAVGNIGLAVLDALKQPAPDLYSLELSSFQLETTASLKACAAVVLNVTEDHLDRYDGLEDYAAAKARIYQGCGWPVFNRDDPVVMQMAQAAGISDPLTFGLSVPAAGQYGLRDHEGRRWLARGDRNLMALDEMRLAGEHNALNALAALALVAAVDLPLEPALAAIREFTGLPHRTQWVRELRGVSYFNDSKGTNVGATLAALKGLPGKTVLIAGGLGKGADFSPLRSVVEDKARSVILIGQDAQLIAEAVGGVTEVLYADSMAMAVSMAAEVAQPGDNVLLSPACASFDMFNNYMHRGDVFSELVRRLPE